MQQVGKKHLIFSELGGKIYRLNLKTGKRQLIYEVKDIAREVQSGLMGLAVHPSKKYVYAMYAFYDSSFNMYSRVVRFKNKKKLNNSQILLDSIPCSSSNLGGRLVHHKDQLYITVGDADRSMRAQDSTSLNGKILRINDDGSIPEGNPIPNSPIFTFGHRNPQGMVKTSQGLFISEHGTFVDDEINVLSNGSNYGWPDNTPVFASPVFNWPESVAPSGIDYCENCLGNNKNYLVVATLKARELVFLEVQNALERPNVSFAFSIATNAFGRLRDVLIDRNDFIYICTSNRDIYGSPKENDDKIIRLKIEWEE